MRIAVNIIIFLFGFIFHGFGQHSDHLTYLLESVDSLLYMDLTKTEQYIDSVFQIASEEKDTAAYVKGLVAKGDCYMFHQPDKAPLGLFLDAKNLATKFSKGEILFLDINNRIGDYYYEIEELDSALMVFNSEIMRLRQLPELSSLEHDYLEAAYLFAGVIKKKQKAYNEAINYYNYYITNEIERAKKENRPPSYGSTLGRLGKVYNLMGDFQLAVQNLKKAIEIGEKAFKERPDEQDFLSSYIMSDLQGISESYIQLNQLDSAIYFLNQSIQYPDVYDYHSKSFSLLGRAYDLKNEHQKAVRAYTTAISKVEEKYVGRKHLLKAEHYAAIGDFYHHKQDYKKALTNYQKSIINLVYDFNDLEISSNPRLVNVLSNEYLLDVLQKKTTTLFDAWKLNKQPITAMILWDTGQKSIELLELIKKENFVFEEDLLELMNKHYELYEILLEVGHYMGADYMEASFLLAEKSKTASILKNLSSTNVRLYESISSSVIQEERRLNRNISELREELYQFQPTTPADTLDNIHLKNRLFEKEEQLKQLRANYQTNQNFQTILPNYLSVQEIQSNFLGERKGLIEYFFGKHNIYAFLIKPDTFYIHKIEEQGKITQYAATLKEDIFHKREEQYIEKASALYQLLIAPLEKYNLPTDLIVIPDGVLYYLPFDVLLEKKPNVPKNYNEYPYLLNKHSISYCLSSTLLHSLQTKQHLTKPVSQVLSFAPDFHKLASTNNDLLADRDQLTQLTYNYPEIQAIGDFVSSKIISGEVASKNEFLDLASNYQYLHLATHGKVDDNNSNFSYIAFSNMVDTLKESYKLYTNELNTLQLNADMVVLSACETGIGKAYKGEGLISLSRGFLAAGAKSVITTLWNINDQLTNKIVTSFYENLKEGMGKAEALRAAKLKYLEESDQFEAHPKYWAAFIPVGDMSALEEDVFIDKTNNKIYWLLGFMGILFAFFLLRRNAT